MQGDLRSESDSKASQSRIAEDKPTVGLVLGRCGPQQRLFSNPSRPKVECSECRLGPVSNTALPHAA